MKSDNVLTSIPNRKLPLKVKILYGTGDIAKTLLVCLTAMFSLYFYTEVCGINSGIASTIILIAKIWDIINDPMMGAIVDRTKSKEGKCRFWLKYMSVPGGIVLALSFICPELTATGKIVWVAVTYTLQGMASTAIMIPMNTMMGRLTSDPVERASLNQIKGIFSLIPNLAVPAVTMPLVIAFGKGDMHKGFLAVAILYGVIYALCNFIVFVGTSGYEPVEYLAEARTSGQNAEQKVQTPISQVLLALLKNTPWLLIIAMYFVDMIGLAIGNSVMTWYYQYNLNNIELMSLVSSISITISLVVYLILGACIKKFGNAGTSVIGCVVAVTGYLIRFLLSDTNVAVILGGSILAQFGSVLAASTILLMIFDAKIYGEWKTGVDNEAILMSGFSVAYKTGQAIGGPIAGYLLMLVPYVPQALVQEQSVLKLWFLESTLIPAIGFAIAALIVLKLRKYEKMVPQMREELKERAEKAKNRSSIG